MKINLSTYRLYDPEKYPDVFAIDDYQFSYHQGQLFHDLVMEKDGSSITLKDPEDNWTMENSELGFKRTIRVKNANILYGPDGIACHDAKIGIAISWKSSDSKQRGIFPIGTIKNCATEQLFVADRAFETAQLRGQTTLATFLYLKCAGAPNDEVKYIQNIPGFMLGEIDNPVSLYLDEVSIFPILEHEDEGGPLWKISFSASTMDDLLATNLQDVFSLYINTKHPYYKNISSHDENGASNKNYNAQLFIEILSESLCQLVKEVKEIDNDLSCLDKRDEMEEGSIADRLKYWRDTLGWHLGDSVLLSMDIREKFEKERKNI